MTHDTLTPDVQHKHFIGRYEVTNPFKRGSEYQLDIWMRTLIGTMGMKIMSGPHVVYSDMPGNRGMTAVAIIETSHVAIHIWDEPFPALVQVDFYTCGDMDPRRVDTAMGWMGVLKGSWRVISRENGIECIDIAEYGHSEVLSGTQKTAFSALKGG